VQVETKKPFNFARMLKRAQAAIEEDAADLRLGPEFQNEHCLLNCEVKLVLDRVKEQRMQTSPRPLNE
jgi:hypothetical protein